jgi:hypothetical protein
MRASDPFKEPLPQKRNCYFESETLHCLMCFDVSDIFINIGVAELCRLASSTDDQPERKRLDG